MRVCLISSMRDAGAYLPHWRRMVDRFTVAPAHIVIAENDSIDDTVAQLDAWPAVTLERFTTGEVKLPREATARRSDYLARCWSRAIDRAMALDWDVAFVTSAEKYTGPRVLGHLLEDVMERDCDMVAPLVLAPVVGFYDTWCFRYHGGQPFDHQAWVRLPVGLSEIASLGGVYAARRAVFAAGCRPGATDGSGCDSVPLCADARAKGFSVWIDTRVQSVAMRTPDEFARYVDASSPGLEAAA